MTGNDENKRRKFLSGLLAIGTLFGAYCLATVGVSTLMMTVTDTSAQAKGHGGHGGHGGHWGGHVGHGGHWHGHPGHVVGHGRGHFWHGRWWGYGVGPCWRLIGPGNWVWICG
jgi:hypothetical protein